MSFDFKRITQKTGTPSRGPDGTVVALRTSMTAALEYDDLTLESHQLDDALVRSYASRIKKYAQRYIRQLPRQVTLSDMVSAGYTGLVEAWMRCDSNRRENFEAFIDHRIRGAMLDELRTFDPLTRDQRAFARRCAAATRQLESTLGHPPSEQELAAMLMIDEAALRTQRSRAAEVRSRRRAQTIEAELCDPPDEFAGRPDALLEERQQRTRMDAAKQSLSPRHQETLRLYYDEQQTLRQIAAVFGVTESRVSQIHAEAITRLRGLLNTD